MEAVEHGPPVIGGGGGETEGDVLKYLDENATQPECHELAEARIGDGADDDFLAAAGHHRLNLNTGDVRVALVSFRAGDNAFVSGLGGICVCDSD